MIVIYGIGADIVSVARFTRLMRRKGNRALKRLFTEEERAGCDVRYAAAEPAVKETLQARFYAKRFAAKEAVVKALGSGFRGGVSFADISVGSDAFGAPVVKLTGAAAALVGERFPGAKINLSLSDEKEYAAAFAVLSMG